MLEFEIHPLRRSVLMGIKLRPIREQTIVITGASSGIGLATATAAARRGARVVLNSRDEADIGRAAEEIREKGGSVTYLIGDVADPEAMTQLAEVAIDTFGGIDTWVNNAGVSIYGTLEDIPLEDARRLFDTNYWGVVHGSLAALPHLRERGAGTLINLGSVLSETGYPLQGHYAASKHAVKGFTDSLRIELEKEGAPIVVTLIEPAAIDTPYPQHARNYLASEPKHAPPVYDPEIVADAILTCAESPHRNLRIGGAAKMYTMMEKVAPGLADRMKLGQFEQQHAAEPPRDEDTLYEPRPHDGSIHGEYPGRVMRRSLYTAAAKRPRATAAAALGIAAIGVGFLAARAFGSRDGD
jgi:NAD(P)-dependent dehydrogenase (short-subunit alcohol dehydrogenase family)